MRVVVRSATLSSSSSRACNSACSVFFLDELTQLAIRAQRTNEPKYPSTVGVSEKELNGGRKKYSAISVEANTENKPGPAPQNHALATTAPKKKNRNG